MLQTQNTCISSIVLLKKWRTNFGIMCWFHYSVLFSRLYLLWNDFDWGMCIIYLCNNLRYNMTLIHLQTIQEFSTLQRCTWDTHLCKCTIFRVCCWLSDLSCRTTWKRKRFLFSVNSIDFFSLHLQLSSALSAFDVPFPAFLMWRKPNCTLHTPCNRNWYSCRIHNARALQ